MLNFGFARNQVVLLETASNSGVSLRSAKDFLVSIFERCLAKTMAGPAGNSEFFFPSTSMFTYANCGSWRNKTQFSLRPVISVLSVFKEC